MATISDYEKLTVRERQDRFFNEAFKRSKVSEIERNLLTIAELCKEHQVTRSAVYKWIYRYSQMRKREHKQVIEPESETRKVLLLKQEVSELQRVIGEKQLKMDFLEKVIELAEAEYGLDIKKKIYRQAVLWYWSDKGRRTMKTDGLYRAAETSKQAFHQYLDKQLLVLEEQQQLLPVIGQVRADHPRLSVRRMYAMPNPQSMGRDKFEQFCYLNGFKLAVKRSCHRTADPLGVARFEDLTAGTEPAGVNQVWASDITYYRIGGRFYYITFIIDLYSRFITGCAVSDGLFTGQATIPALNMALKQRGPLPGLIFHPDGGGQYYSKGFLAVTKSSRIRNSMCESVYENAHAERANGTVKNGYLVHYAPQDYQQLITMTYKAVKMYNFCRAHSSLQNRSPADYELSTKTALVNKEKRSKKEILQQ